MRRRCCCTSSSPATSCYALDCLTFWKNSIFVTWEGTWLPPSADYINRGLEAVVPDLVNGSMLLPFQGPLCSWFNDVPATLGPHSIKSFSDPCPVLTTNIPSFQIYQEVEVIIGGGLRIPQFFVRYVVRDKYTYSFSCNGTPYTGNFGPTTTGSVGIVGTATSQVEADWVIDCPGRTATWDHPNTPTLNSFGTFSTCAYLFGGGFCNAKEVITASPGKVFSLNKVVIEF